MALRTFSGFGGRPVTADDLGDRDDPAVLLIAGSGEGGAIWAHTADILVDAGRRVILVDPGGTLDQPIHSLDIRALLAQLETRPVVATHGDAGWAALAALEQDAPNLATGLVLVDLTSADPSLPTQEKALGIATVLVEGWMRDDVGDARLPDAESASLDDPRFNGTEKSDRLGSLLVEYLERFQPRVPPEYRSGSDARTLRDALGCFATGVTVVTTMADDGVPVGLTVNSFTSLSLDPPLLLVCISDRAGSAAAFRKAEHFTVNVLHIGQQPASVLFATRGEDRFAATEWTAGEHGSPVLSGSLSAFECSTHAVHDGGDHFILVGKVERATFEPHRDPLLYFRGKYRRLHFA